MNSKPITIYILELESEKYYVGQTKHLRERIRKHFDGKGSAWTKRHRPISVISQLELNTSYWRDALEVEKEFTLELMSSLGWENVRGAGWSMVEMKSKPKELEDYIRN